MSTETRGDYQFIDLVAILELAARSGLVSRFERTVSRSFAGWQISLPGVCGVFDLLLKDHQPEGLALRRKNVAQYFRTDFLLKYYPDPDEEIFRTFSLYERILRQSEVFDGQRHPRSEIRQEIHESYFTAAEIILALSRSRNALGLCLRSQDEWREIRGSPLQARDHTGKTWRLPVGSVDRRVPGWAIGLRFFLPLVKAYTLRHGTPGMMRLSESKGRVWRAAVERTESRPSRSVLEKRLDVGFFPTADQKAKRELRLYLARSFGEKDLLREKSLRSIESLLRMVQ